MMPPPVVLPRPIAFVFAVGLFLAVIFATARQYSMKPPDAPPTKEAALAKEQVSTSKLLADAAIRRSDSPKNRSCFCLAVPRAFDLTTLWYPYGAPAVTRPTDALTRTPSLTRVESSGSTKEMV